MFSAIFDTFRGFFSRAFWFGNFLPVAVVASVHAVLAATEFPDRVNLRHWIDAGISEKAGPFTVVFAAAVILAYMLGPMIPLFRGLLDGTLLPGWLHTWLRNARGNDWRNARREYDAAMKRFSDLKDFDRVQTSALHDARAEGGKLNAITDAPAIDAASASVTKLNEMISRGDMLTLSDLKGAVDALSAALGANSTTLPTTASDDERIKADKVERANAELFSILTQSKDEASHDFVAAANRNAMLDRHDWQATRVGDARVKSERYCFDAYRVDFNYLWPRLQLAMNSGDKTSLERLTDAESQIDFAAFTLILFWTIPAVWLPLLLVSGSHPPWIFAAVGFITLPVASFLYELVVRSYVAFGAIVETVIDRYRLDLLTILHQPLPLTLSTERDLWDQMSKAGEPGNAVDLTYKHPTS